VRVHHNPQLDPNDPATWPALLRERDICRRPGYSGLLPLTQSAFRDAVTRGDVDQPISFGSRINCWHKKYILTLQQHGITRRLLNDETEDVGGTQKPTRRAGGLAI
jgi:hypothetical protein